MPNATYFAGKSRKQNGDKNVSKPTQRAPERGYHLQQPLVRAEMRTEIALFGYIALVIFCNVWQMVDGKSIEFSRMSNQQRRQVTERGKSLHRKGVCHGNIRPTNFINTNNKCFIIDFGFSNLIKDQSDLEAEMEVLIGNLSDFYE